MTTRISCLKKAPRKFTTEGEPACLIMALPVNKGPVSLRSSLIVIVGLWFGSNLCAGEDPLRLIIDVSEDVKNLPNEEQLRKLFQKASDLIWNLTSEIHLNYSIQDVVFLVPENFTGVDGQEYKISEKPNIIIDSPNLEFGDTPYTKHLGRCGDNGEYVHLTETFLSEAVKQTGPWKDKAVEVLVHELFHNFFGVFDEYADVRRNDKHRSNLVQPMTCPTNIKGAWKTASAKCSKASETCFYEPEEDNIPHSIMSYNHLASPVHICSDSDGSPVRHGRSAITKQNTKCDYQSVAQVMKNKSSKFKPYLHKNNITLNYMKKGASRSIVIIAETCLLSDDVFRSNIVLSVNTYIRHSSIESVSVGIKTYTKKTCNQNDIRPTAPITEQDVIEIIHNRDIKNTVSGTDSCLNSSRPGYPQQIPENNGMLQHSSKPPHPTTSLPTTTNCVDFGPLVRETEGSQAVFILSKSTYAAHSDIFTNRSDISVIIIHSGKNSQGNGHRNKHTSQRVLEWDASASLPLNEILTGTSKSPLGSQYNGLLQRGKSKKSTGVVEMYWNPSRKSTAWLFLSGDVAGVNHVDVSSHSGSHTSRLNINATDDYTANITEYLSTKSGRYTFTTNGTTDVILEVWEQTNGKSSWKENILTRAWLNTNVVNFASTDEERLPTVMAEVTKGYEAVVMASVSATITKASGEIVELYLHDNGTGADATKDDGIYSSYIVHFDIDGYYRISIKVNNSNMRARIKSKRQNQVFNPEDVYAGYQEDSGDLGLSSLGEDFDSASDTPELIAENVPEDGDLFPPNQVIDMRLLQSTDGRVQLHFTAAGDELTFYKAQNYTVYFAYKPVRELMVEIITYDVTDRSVPGKLVVVEFHQDPKMPTTVKDTENATLYFTVAFTDKVGKRGELSNIVSWSPHTLVSIVEQITTTPNPYASPTTPGTGAETTPPATPDSGKLSSGVLIAIAVCSLVAVIVISVACVLCCWVKNRGKEHVTERLRSFRNRLSRVPDSSFDPPPYGPPSYRETTSEYSSRRETDAYNLDDAVGDMNYDGGRRPSAATINPGYREDDYASRDNPYAQSPKPELPKASYPETYDTAQDYQHQYDTTLPFSRPVQDYPSYSGQNNPYDTNKPPERTGSLSKNFNQKILSGGELPAPHRHKATKYTLPPITEDGIPTTPAPPPPIYSKGPETMPRQPRPHPTERPLQYQLHADVPANQTLEPQNPYRGQQPPGYYPGTGANNNNKRDTAMSFASGTYEQISDLSLKRRSKRTETYDQSVSEMKQMLQGIVTRKAPEPTQPPRQPRGEYVSSMYAEEGIDDNSQFNAFQNLASATPLQTIGPARMAQHGPGTPYYNKR